MGIGDTLGGVRDWAGDQLSWAWNGATSKVGEGLKWAGSKALEGVGAAVDQVPGVKETRSLLSGNGGLKDIGKILETAIPAVVGGLLGSKLPGGWITTILGILLVPLIYMGLKSAVKSQFNKSANPEEPAPSTAMKTDFNPAASGVEQPSTEEVTPAPVEQPSNTSAQPAPAPGM